MMIAISQNPQQITAGGLFELSFKGFSSVCTRNIYFFYDKYFLIKYQGLFTYLI